MEETRAPWLFPMVMMAAHTDARRCELLRAEFADVTDDSVIALERRGKRGWHTQRRVPLSSALKLALDEWLSVHPGGRPFSVIGTTSPSPRARTSQAQRPRDFA